jgi:subtilisin family serine protease
MGGSRRFGTACVIAVVACVSGGSARAQTVASAAPTTDPHAVPGQALVRFRPGTAPTSARAILARAGAATTASIPEIGFQVVRFGAPAAAVLRALRADPAVAVAEPDYTGRVATDSCLDDPCDGTPGQWQFAMDNAAFAWRAPAQTSAPVTIAILDTHVDATHPDFVNADGSSQLDLANAHDWVPSSRWTGAAAYHGTFVAGLAAAAENGKDMASVSGPARAARILPLTVVDGGGTTDAASLADAIVYAARHGARVINLSLGITADSVAVHDAIRYASATALVVAAAGNNTGSAAFYPGSYPEAMSVSGTNAEDERASCSNYNANVAVSAPADRLIGDAPMPQERTQAPCGTSAAAPQVSGLGALLFSQDPARTPAEVRAIIERTADDLGAPGRDDVFGAGRINAERALAQSGPRVTGASATVASPNGRSTVRATVPAGTRRAQLVLDRPGAAPREMNVDGTNAVADVDVAASAGPHPVWIRAFDGTSWGAHAVTVVDVDSRAPQISDVSVANGARAVGQPMAVAFTATDDYSQTVSFGVEFRSTATKQIVYSQAIYGRPAGAQRFDWMPGLSVPGGHYTVKIAVADAAGNVSSTEAGAILA